MKNLKASELRPCDICRGTIVPIFYRMQVKFQQTMVDKSSVDQVLGTAQIFGGNLSLGSMMSPNSDATRALGYELTKEFVICANCLPSFGITAVELMAQYEEENDGDE